MACNDTTGRIILGTCCAVGADPLQMSVVAVNMSVTLNIFNPEFQPPRSTLLQYWGTIYDALDVIEFPDYNLARIAYVRKFNPWTAVSVSDFTTADTACQSRPGDPPVTLDRAFPGSGSNHNGNQLHIAAVKVKYKFSDSTNTNWVDEKVQVVYEINFETLLPQLGCSNAFHGWLSSDDILEVQDVGAASGVEISYNPPILTIDQMNESLGLSLTPGEIGTALRRTLDFVTPVPP